MIEKLSHIDIILVLCQIGLMILFARVFGELARRLQQPMVVGEILAGIILGPTIFGYLMPESFELLFPAKGHWSLVLDGFIQVALVLLLFIAGLEVELDLVIQQGRRALYTSLSALAFPFLIGFGYAIYDPTFFGITDESHYLIFALFFGTVLSITALPVLARVLMDLNIFKSKMGMLIIAAAMVIDVLGWLIFAVILSMIDGNSEKMGVGSTLGLTLLFTIITLTIGKVLINAALPWINRNFAWPGGLLSMAMVICFFAAAFTEWIGIHSIFGAFIFGIALGDSEHMSERAKEIVHQFINNIFAPLFFVSIGLSVNFIANFNIPMILVILLLATIGKVLGGYLGAKAGKMDNVKSLAVGFAMNTHGTLEIILGTIALNTGIITEEIFVAIVVMVILTILVSTPLMRYFLDLNRRINKLRKKKLRMRMDYEED
jgi:Kef-type K+ transport system membrane component KefB